MKKGLFDKRIPTVMALVFLAIVVGISTLLIQNGVFYIGKAAPDTQPQGFLVTNITDTSFTALFTTNGQVDAVLSTKDSQTGNSLTLDDRDKRNGGQGKYFSHHITVPNLTPNTTYTFRLIVGGKEYSSSSYSVKTGQTISSRPPDQKPLFGKVLLPDGAAGNDSIIVAKTDQSESVSSITDEKGEFILPTNSLRNSASSDYITLNESTVITISIYRQQFSSKVTSNYREAQNLPPVTLQQQYTFVNNQESVATGSSQFNFTNSQASGATVDILSPKQAEEFVDQRPLFRGTSYPNSGVSLLIPGVAEEQLLTKADGSWNFRTPGNIPQGIHTITITVNDPNGKAINVTRRFTIFALGSQIVESATPSATPTLKPTTIPTKPQPTPTTTPKPTSQPTLAPTPTGVASSSPTLTPTVTPTATVTPLPTIYFTPTKTPPIKAPGASENTIALTGISIVLIIAGISLLFVL